MVVDFFPIPDVEEDMKLVEGVRGGRVCGVNEPIITVCTDKNLFHIK